MPDLGYLLVPENLWAVPGLLLIGWFLCADHGRLLLVVAAQGLGAFALFKFGPALVAPFTWLTHGDIEMLSAIAIAAFVALIAYGVYRGRDFPDRTPVGEQ